MKRYEKLENQINEIVDKINELDRVSNNTNISILTMKVTI